MFTGPIWEHPKTVAEMIFNFKVDGSTVTGHAHITAWPGDARFPVARSTGTGSRSRSLGSCPGAEATKV